MNARYPWFAQARASLGGGFDQTVIDAVNARETPTAHRLHGSGPVSWSRANLSRKKGLSDETLRRVAEDDGRERPCRSWLRAWAAL